MANARALVLTAGGKTQEAADADTIIVSGTLKNNSSTLTINAAGTSMLLQVGGTSYLTVTSAAVTAANGSAFTGSGSGLTSIPAGTALTGQVPIANGGTGAATASANLVFAGPTSGSAAAPSFRALVAADLPTTAPSVTGLTLWSTPVAGELGYQTGTAGTLAKAKADAASTAPGVVGYYNGVSGAVTALVSGVPASVFFDSGLNGGATGAPAAGQDVYLSDGTAGHASNNAPTTSAHVVLYLGTIKDPTGYDNTNGAALSIWPRVGLPMLRA